MDYGFFDSLIDGIFVIDEDRAIQYCNEAAASLVDASVKRLTKSKSKKLFDVFTVSDSSSFICEFGKEGKESPAPVKEMDMILAKDQSSLKVQVSIQPFQDPDGASLWIVMLHDVTLEERLHTKYQGELEQKEDMIAELKDARAKLEEYSKNLEKMVDDRTKQVKKANRMLQAIMNSLGQGFLVFDSEGVCGSVYTEACKDVLEATPTGENIADVLKLDGADRDQFEQWKAATFSEALPFDSMKELAPRLFNHSEDWHVELDYFPIYSEECQKLENVVMGATDKTSEYKANLALEKEREFVGLVIKLLKNKNQFSEFLGAAKQSIMQVYRLVESGREALDSDHLFRILHTLEGEAGAFHAWPIRESSRHLQELLEPMRRDDRKATSKEVAELLEGSALLRSSYYSFLQENKDLFQMVALGSERKIELSSADLIKFSELMESAGVDKSLVEHFRDQFLLEDVPSLLVHYNDAAKQVAEKQGKKIRPILFQNEGVKILPEPYRQLLSSLVHVFRNSVDHGIETPEERIMSGKDEFGNITVRSSYKIHDGERWLHLVISDDGGGVDSERLREKLKHQRGDQVVSAMTDSEVLQTIFDAGLSSRDSVGEFSGRGVGMDAVKSAVVELGGQIEVTSTLGKETVITIDIPELSGENSSSKAA